MAPEFSSINPAVTAGFGDALLLEAHAELPQTLAFQNDQGLYLDRLSTW